MSMENTQTGDGSKGAEKINNPQTPQTATPQNKADKEDATASGWRGPFASESWEEYDGQLDEIGRRLKKFAELFSTLGDQFDEAHNSLDLTKTWGVVMTLKHLERAVPIKLHQYFEESLGVFPSGWFVFPSQLGGLIEQIEHIDEVKVPPKQGEQKPQPPRSVFQ